MRHGIDDRLKRLQRRLAADLLDDIVVPLGHHHRMAHRPATLRNDRLHVDPPTQRDANESLIEHLIIAK